VLDQQGASDQLQNRSAVPSGSSVIRKLSRKWFDDLEHFRNLAFVVSQHDAFGQDIGNDEQSLRQHIPQLNRPSRRHLIFERTVDRDNRGFLLKTREPSIDPGLQPFQKTNFIFRRNTDQHRDAITKKYGDAGFAKPERKRHRRQGFIFKAHRVDPVSNIQGVCGKSPSCFGGNNFRLAHDAVSQKSGFRKCSASMMERENSLGHRRTLQVRCEPVECLHISNLRHPAPKQSPMACAVAKGKSRSGLMLIAGPKLASFGRRRNASGGSGE
jgi:hypothetical protein